MKDVLGSIFRRLPKAYNGDKTPVWPKLIEEESALWNRAVERAKGGSRILIATSTGCYEHGVLMESALAAALTLRGVNVDIFLCDLLPCCQWTKITNVSPEVLLAQDRTPRCKKCYAAGQNHFKPIAPVHWMSQFVSDDGLRRSEKISIEIPFDDISDYKYEGLAVGEHAMAGALRYYARGDLNSESCGEQILRRYLKASLLTAFAVQELLNRNSYETAVFHHGIYVPQGIVGEVCRKNNVHVVTWNSSYRKQTFVFSHDNSYHFTMIDEPLGEWEHITMDEETEKTILDYLRSRWHGTEDWIWFHEKPVEDVDRVVKELGIDPDKPFIGMLSSVMWDAQLHYKSNAFKNMLDWVFKTIDYFSGRPDLQLILRVHPAEIRGLVPSRQKLVDEINSRYPKLPDNIFVIPPESEISTYAIMEKCNSVIIYNTKTGIEISSMGIPVIVAGEAWIRNKGFSIDACSPEEYYAILDKLPLPHGLDKERLERARKYAYHFFFRRMIEVPLMISPKKFKFVLKLPSLRELLPGAYHGLDVICDGIINKKSFTANPIIANTGQSRKCSL